MTTNTHEQSYDGWIGRDAYDSAGDKLGEITDIYYDDVSQRPEWIKVKTGRMGGARLVPIGGSQIYKGKGKDEGNEHLQVQFSADQIKGAPDIDADRHITAQEEQELYRHYGFDWQDSKATNYGYGKDYRNANRPDREHKYRAFDQKAGTWGTEARLHDEHAKVVGEATATSEVVEKRPVQEKVRLRKYQHTDMVPVTKEEVRVEKVDATTEDTTPRPTSTTTSTTSRNVR